MRNHHRPEVTITNDPGEMGDVAGGQLYPGEQAIIAQLKPTWNEVLDWVDQTTIGILCGVSRQAMNKRIAKEDWPFRQAEGQGGGREYPVWMLPPQARAIVAKLNTDAALALGGAMAEGIVMGRKITLANDMKMMHAHVHARGTRRAAQGSSREQGGLRLDLLVAYNTYRLARGVHGLKAYDVFVEAWNSGAIEASHELKSAFPTMTARTLRRWNEARAKDPAYGINPAHGARRRGKTIIDRDAEVKDLVLGLINSTPHVTAKLVMRALRARFDDERSRIPSYRSLQRWIETWKRENPALLAALKSPDHHRSKYGVAAGKADEGIIGVNMRWELDSTPTDVMLADNRRHAIIGVIDVYSRRVKLLVARTSKGTAIAALLRRALLDWGVPDLIKTDNGADYTSKYIQRVLAQLNIPQELCPPFTPQAKPFIERALGTFSHGLLEMMPEFIGHNVAERKAIEDRKSFAQRLMKSSGEPVKMNLTPEALQDFCDRWSDDLYAHDPHKGLGGKTPFQVAQECDRPIRRINDERALDLLLSEAPSGGTRVVGKKGLTIDNAVFSHPALGALEGQVLRVLYDETDTGRVHLFDPDRGDYICSAICPERLGVSRAELAMVTRARQQAETAAKKREMKAAARRSGAADQTKIIQEILDHKRDQADKLAAFPKRAVDHDAPELERAAEAASILDLSSARLTSERSKPALGPQFTEDEVNARLAELDCGGPNSPQRDSIAVAEDTTRQGVAEGRAGDTQGPIGTNIITLRTKSPASALPGASDDELSGSDRPAPDRPQFSDDRSWALWIINNPTRADQYDRDWLLGALRSQSFRMLLDVTDAALDAALKA